MNQWLNKMERKLGRYAIPNLMNYVVILYAVGALVCWRAPELYFEYLMLDARAILHGQIWRIVTFLMWPLSGDLFLNVLASSFPVPGLLEKGPLSAASAGHAGGRRAERPGECG